MTSALAWLEPPSATPMTSADPEAAPGYAGTCYDGLVGRVPQGSYLAIDLLAGPEGRAWALRTLIPDGAALARTTAVWVHTGRLCPRRAEVVVRAQRRVHSPVVVHRQRLTADDVVLVGTVPTTTPVRTAVDLLCFADERTAVAGTRALLARCLTVEAVAQTLRRPRRRLPARRALGLLAQAQTPTGRRRP